MNRAQRKKLAHLTRKIKDRILAAAPRTDVRPAAGAPGNSDRIVGGLALTGVVTIAAAAGDAKERTVEILAYSGGPLQQGHMGWSCPVVVDLDGIDAGNGTLPLLDNHGPGPYSDESARGYVVGQSTKTEVRDGGFHLSGKLFDVTDAAKQIVALADKGFRWQASIGARSVAKEFYGEGTTVTVNGRTFEGPCYVSRKTKIREVSFVVIGADEDGTDVVVAHNPPAKPGASPGVDLMAKKMTFASYCKAKGHGDDPDKLDEKVKAKLKADFDAEPDDDDDDDKDKKKDAKARATLDLQAGFDRQHQEFRQKMAAETARIAGIQRICASNALLTIEVEHNGQKRKVGLQEHAIEAGWDVERTQMRYELEDLRNQRPNQAPNVYATSKAVMNDAVLECAVMQAAAHDVDLFDEKRYDQSGMPAHLKRATIEQLKARYTDQVQQAAHSHFKSRVSVQQVLIAAAQTNGKRVPHVLRDGGDIAAVLRACDWTQPDEIRADGAATVSIANTLANVLNKFLLAGMYLFVEGSWQKIAATRPVKDFKPTSSIALTGDFVYQKISADGKIASAALTDEAYPNQVDTFARKLNLTRQHIINDDLSALTTLPKLLGIGAADALNILFWTVWLSQMGNAADANAFWFNHASASTALGGKGLNSNLLSGGTSPLSSAALQLAKQTYDKQVKPNGNPLGVDAKILLVPTELWQVGEELTNPKATTIVYGGASAARQPNIQVFANKYELVMSRYLSNSNFSGNSTTAWWLLADPNQIAAIEVAFLNGQQQPTVQTAQADFSELGIMMRGFFDFGVAAQNPRAGVKSNGA